MLSTGIFCFSLVFYLKREASYWLFIVGSNFWIGINFLVRMCNGHVNFFVFPLFLVADMLPLGKLGMFVFKIELQNPCTCLLVLVCRKILSFGDVEVYPC